MNSRATLAILLITMLLSDSLNCENWQGTGSGMNSTVITEIWTGLDTNLDAALKTNNDGINAFTSEISGRLNTRWDKAWNVVLVIGISTNDAILYGYAFRNQWMWHNGFSSAALGSYYGMSLIVWKDYNCQDWKNIADGVTETSSFSTAQKDLIKAEIDKMTLNGIISDVWGTAHTMMNSLQTKAEFSTGGYSVVMSNRPFSYYGYICRVRRLLLFIHRTWQQTNYSFC